MTDSIFYRRNLRGTGDLGGLFALALEATYQRLVGYGFARRYVGEKTVAVVGSEELGYGTRLLAETSESVVGMARSSEAVEVALKAYPAPNVSYEVVNLTELPYPDEHFDVLVALGVIEDLPKPEGFLAEIRRVLKHDGLLVVSFPDRRGHPGGPQTPALLERHFGRVHTYRQGAVAGGIVYRASSEAAETLVESAWLPPADLRFDSGLPETRSILAVCGETGNSEGDEQPYLLLDHDRRVFDEREDLAEDVEMLREEIENMQRTEVQAFRDSLRLRGSEISYLRAQIRRLEHSEAQAKTQLRTQIRRLEHSEAQAKTFKARIHAMENSTTWRIFKPYRQLRARLDAARKSAPGGSKETLDHRRG